MSTIRLSSWPRGNLLGRQCSPGSGATRELNVAAGSTINIGAGGLAGTLNIGTLANDGTLNFNHTDAISLSAAISGAGTITKHSTGATTLTNMSSFNGVISASGGELILQGSLNAPLYAAGTSGTLRFDGSTVNLSGVSAIRSTGGVVEYAAATVNGGVLRGWLPGEGSHTIVSSASSTHFNGVTIQNSVDLIQDSNANFTNVTNGGRLTNNAFLLYDGGVNTTSGHILVNDSFNTRDFTNNGRITINAGGSLFHRLGNLANGGGSRITVNAGGLMNLMDGSELDLNGALLVNNGTVSGTVNVNFGSLATGTGSYGVVNVNQGSVFSPCNSPGIVTVESLHFANSSIIGAPVLAIELGGTTPGSEHDQVNVTAAIVLGGILDVSLLPGFAPSVGDSFDILDWGTLSGIFSAVNLPALPGLAWDLTSLYSDGALSVMSASLPGDFNGDNFVDAADYTVWRDGLGDLYTAADYLLWRANFGNSYAQVPTASPAHAGVPEPIAVLLAALNAAIVGLWMRRDQ